MPSELNYRALARQSLIVCADYVQRLDQAYAARRELRKQGGIPVLAFCGHGRHGKDQSAEFLAANTCVKYTGSVSRYVLPLVAHALGQSQDYAWKTRHKNREFWYEFCNAVRASDPAILVRMTLSEQDVIAGIRSTAELWTAWGEEHIDHIVWVEREGFPADPTLQYRLETFQHLGLGDRDHRGYQIVNNCRDLEYLEQSVFEIAQHLGVPTSEEGTTYGQKSRTKTSTKSPAHREPSPATGSESRTG